MLIEWEKRCDRSRRNSETFIQRLFYEFEYFLDFYFFFEFGFDFGHQQDVLILNILFDNLLILQLLNIPDQNLIHLQTHINNQLLQLLDK
jgi:hypothetical protein